MRNFSKVQLVDNIIAIYANGDPITLFQLGKMADLIIKEYPEVDPLDIKVVQYAHTTKVFVKLDDELNEWKEPKFNRVVKVLKDQHVDYNFGKIPSVAAVFLYTMNPIWLYTITKMADIVNKDFPTIPIEMIKFQQDVKGARVFGNVYLHEDFHLGDWDVDTVRIGDRFNPPD